MASSSSQASAITASGRNRKLQRRAYNIGLELEPMMRDQALLLQKTTGTQSTLPHSLHQKPATEVNLSYSQLSHASSQLGLLQVEEAEAAGPSLRISSQTREALPATASQGNISAELSSAQATLLRHLNNLRQELKSLIEKWAPTLGYAPDSLDELFNPIVDQLASQKGVGISRRGTMHPVISMASTSAANTNALPTSPTSPASLTAPTAPLHLSSSTPPPPISTSEEMQPEPDLPSVQEGSGAMGPKVDATQPIGARTRSHASK